MRTVTRDRYDAASFTRSQELVYRGEEGRSDVFFKVPIDWRKDDAELLIETQALPAIRRAQLWGGMGGSEQAS